MFLLSICRCLNQCTYCKTKHARGELGSYHPDDIVARAKQSFEGKKWKSMQGFDDDNHEIQLLVEL